MFKVCLNTPTATVPTRGTVGAAGYDLYASKDVIIPPNSRKLVSTGISIEIPSTHYARIASRSSLGLKGIDVGAGVVDSDYRGEVKVLLINCTSEEFPVKIGDRIAQIIFTVISTPDLQIVERRDLDESLRGEGGFGSTDK